MFMHLYKKDWDRERIYKKNSNPNNFVSLMMFSVFSLQCETRKGKNFIDKVEQDIFIEQRTPYD